MANSYSRSPLLSPKIARSAARLAVIGAGAISIVAGAQTEGRNSWQGVFTAEQADRGKATYTEHCAQCHGASLSGADVVPALTGATFASSWNGTSAADLFTRIHDTMPLNDPGSLRPAEAVDVEAYLLASNGYPAGDTALPASPGALAHIKILTTKPAS